MGHKINKTGLPASRPAPELFKTRLDIMNLNIFNKSITYMFIISMVKK